MFVRYGRDGRWRYYQFVCSVQKPFSTEMQARLDVRLFSLSSKDRKIDPTQCFLFLNLDMQRGS